MIVEPKDLKPVYIFNGSEKDIEAHIMDNIHDISRECGWGEIKEVHQQFNATYGSGRIRVDIALIHKDNTATIIEVKASGKSRVEIFGAIGQSLFYGKKLKNFWGAIPRMVVASSQFDYDLYEMTKDYNLPICFLMVDGDRCIYLS